MEWVDCNWMGDLRKAEIEDEEKDENEYDDDQRFFTSYSWSSSYSSSVFKIATGSEKVAPPAVF